MCLTEDFERTAWHTTPPSFLFVQPQPCPLSDDSDESTDSDTRSQDEIATEDATLEPAHSFVKQGVIHRRDPPVEIEAGTSRGVQSATQQDEEHAFDSEPVGIDAAFQGEYYLINSWTPLSISIRSPVSGKPLKVTTSTCANRGIIKRHSLRGTGRFSILLDRLQTKRFDDEEIPEVMRENLQADKVVFSADSHSHGSRCLGETALRRVFELVFLFRIKSCENVDCTARWKLLDQAAPRCEWRPFRELILTVLACWMPRFLSGLITDMFENPEDIVKSCLDLHGVLDLSRWAGRFAFGTSTHKPIPSMILGHHEKQMLKMLAPGFESRAMELTRKCSDVDICPNRLWNLSPQSFLGTMDVSHIAEIALKRDHERVAGNQDNAPTKELYQHSDVNNTSVEQAHKRPCLNGESCRDPKCPACNHKMRHNACTEHLCQHSDMNNTSVEQAHKHPCLNGESCQEPEFPAGTLDSVFRHDGRGKDRERGWQPTAWLIDDMSAKKIPSLVEPKDLKYIAISHVWSDGTGAGVKGPGLVNQCLLNYFSEIAKSLGCNGIWWDTICIPRERQSRSIALDTMLENYRRAKCTIIHDQALADMQWTDDGSPAAALILSAWFSRGWTAAELLASKGHDVKIVFKSPDPDGAPLLKDFDTDILAWDASKNLDSSESFDPNKTPPIPPLGHYLVSDILKQFRLGIFEPEQSGVIVFGRRLPDPEHLKRILRVFRSRTTSWARDRMLIPGLICLPSESIARLPGSEITKLILKSLKTIDFEDLLHPAVPVRQFGPWSWCPSSIFDLGVYTGTNRAIGDMCSMEVNSSGIMTAQGLYAYNLLDQDTVTPVASHPSTRARVLNALSRRSHCMLLTNSKWSNDSRLCILCMAIRAGALPPHRREMHCRWIACVYVNSRNHPEVNPRSHSEPHNHRRRLGGDVKFSFGEKDSGDDSIDFRHLHSYLTRQLPSKVNSEYSVIWLSEYAKLAASVDESGEQVQNSLPWLPQPTKFFLPSKGRDKSRQTSMVIDFRTAENKVALSEVSLENLGQKIVRCGANHTFRCGGVVEMCWELSGHHPMNIWTFTSIFHIVSRVITPGYSTGISIGKEDFKSCLLPMSRKVFSLGNRNLARIEGLTWPKMRVAILLNSPRSNDKMTWPRWLEESDTTDLLDVPQILREVSPEEVDRNEMVVVSEDEIRGDIKRVPKRPWSYD